MDNGAVAEGMRDHYAAKEYGVRGEFIVSSGPPAIHVPMHQPLIPRPNWEQEAAERRALEQERERQERDKILAAELAKLTDTEDQETYPAPKTRKRWGR